MEILDMILDIVEDKDVDFWFYKSSFGVPKMRITKENAGRVYKWECIFAARKTPEFGELLRRQIEIWVERIEECVHAGVKEG